MIPYLIKVVCTSNIKIRKCSLHKMYHPFICNSFKFMARKVQPRIYTAQFCKHVSNKNLIIKKKTPMFCRVLFYMAGTSCIYIMLNHQAIKTMYLCTSSCFPKALVWCMTLNICILYEVLLYYRAGNADY